LVVVPLVTHGVTIISRLQLITQPIWLVMLVLPFIYVFRDHPNILQDLAAYPGASGAYGEFNVLAFGSALTVGIALITQMGEQADYLRFMPEKRPERAGRWWAAVFVGGPGWVILGVLKMLGGALLAWLAMSYAIPVARAVDPNQMYLVAWEKIFSSALVGHRRGGTVRGDLAAQDQRHQCLCGLAGVVELLCAADAQPSGTGGVGGVQRPHRLAVDGAEPVSGAGQGAGLVLQHRDCLDDGRGGRPGGEQADGLVTQGHRVQARLSCTTSTRWVWGRWAWPRWCR
jgi:hypothetical protein